MLRTELLLLAACILVVACSFRGAIGATGGSCSTSLAVNGNSRTYSTCTSLTNWAHLAWTYDPSNKTLDAVFRALLQSSSAWAGWGLNFGPVAAMAGANVLLGFRDSGGVIRLAQYRLTADTKRGTLPSPASTGLRLVPSSSLVDITGNVITIFSKVILPANQSSTVNLVWSRGPGISNLSPLPHPMDSTFLRQTTGTIDLTSNRVLDVQAPHQQLKNQHGILNVVGWGIFLPIGVMVARYLRPFADPAWFYGHSSLQSLGYILGTVGWGLGLKLSSYRGTPAVYQVHGNIGTAIFVFASLQVLAFILRPKKDDKFRIYWNVYHHGIGYLTLVLIFTNIYKGFSILQPPKTWQNLYTAFLVLAVLVAVVLEAYTWYLGFKKKQSYPAYALDSPSAGTKGHLGWLWQKSIDTGNKIIHFFV